MKRDLFSKNIDNILSLTKSNTYNTNQINMLCNELKEKKYIAQSMPLVLPAAQKPALNFHHS